MNIPSHPEGSTLRQANKALRDKDYQQAISLYTNAIIEESIQTPGILDNLAIAQSRYQQERSTQTILKVGVCGWELSHNGAGRVYTIAQLHQALGHTVKIIGFQLPGYGDGKIWEPIRNSTIPITSLKIQEPKTILNDLIKLVIANPFDVLHLSKPRINNIVIGLLYKIIWQSQVMIDIDDEELTFVDAKQSISLHQYLQEHGNLPTLEHLDNQLWTQLAVGLASEFDEITVSGPALGKKYSGQIIRHARNEEEFKDISRYRQSTRDQFSIDQTKKVFLFFGTPRNHKGLLEIASAISKLQDPNKILVIVGSFPPENQSIKNELQNYESLKIIFIDNQPFETIPKVLSIADYCVIWQDEASLVSTFQVPAKLSDALAANIPIFLNQVPAIKDLILTDAFHVLSKDELHTQLKYFIGDDHLIETKKLKGQSLFQSEFSFSANKPRLENALRSARAHQGTISPVLAQFAIKLNPILARFFSTESQPQKKQIGQDHTEADLINYQKLSARYQSINRDQIQWGKEAAKRRIQGLVSIVIPIYGQGKLTEQCVHSIFRHTAEHQFELILVDNDSDLATKEVLKSLCNTYPKIKLHTNTENLHFALGNNLGFTQTTGEFLVFINNDTEVTAGWLNPLLKALIQPKVAIVQPKLIYPSGDIQCIGIVFSEKSALGYPIYANMKPDATWVNKSRPFQAVTGACMMMRATDYILANGFDPSFINGQEDVDLCLRITQIQNQYCWYEAKSTVIHKESQTPNRHAYTTFNRKTFTERWKSKIIADDFKYYEADQFIAGDYQSDRPDQAIAIFKPNLQHKKSDGKIVKQTPPSKQASISNGLWKMVGKNLEGWIISDQPRECELIIFIDEQPFHDLLILCRQNEQTHFHFQIPAKFLDAREHQIEVRIRSNNHSIRHIDGNNTETFIKAVPYAIDSIENGFIRGWAFDVNNPGDSICIELFDGSTKITEIITNLKRADVNQQFNITGNHGFEIAIPAKQFNHIFHDLKIFAKGELLEPDPKKRLSQKLTSDLISKSDERYRGVVEAVTPEILTGWALDRLEPTSPVQIEIYIDSIFLATLTANIFQKRFVPLANFGYHGFRFEFPKYLMSSSKRRIEVKFAGSNKFLEFKEFNSNHANIFFPLIDFFHPYQIYSNKTDFTKNLPSNIQGPNKYRYENQVPLLSIIVLNWNGANLLEQLLNSVNTFIDCKNVEILIIDHGSDDNSESVADKYSKNINLRWIQREKNYSFSASNNFAANLASGEHLLFLNNDIVCFQDSLKSLQQILINDQSVGIVGMQLVEPIPTNGGHWQYQTHHRGIAFAPKRSHHNTLTYLPHEIADTYSPLGSNYELSAVTAAALMCRKSDFAKLNGFDEHYFYGLEDVDFCLRVTQKLNKRVICCSGSIALHNRGYTRSSKLSSEALNPIVENRNSQLDNEKIFIAKNKSRLQVEILKSLLVGGTQLRLKPLRVTFVVTDASSNTPAGDFYTAMEMAIAMQKFGWETMFVKKDMGHILGTDVLIVMRHDYDLRKIQDANPGMVIIGWIRNRLNQWLESPFFQDYHLFYCSSKLAVKEIKEKTGRLAHLLPIATNEARFYPTNTVDKKSLDIVFTGSYWGAERDAVNLLSEIHTSGSFAIYGYGWEKHPYLNRYWRESVPYEELNTIYNLAKIVIDDSHPVTREFNSLNSRIFDSIAAGSLVITNCEGGAQELFGDAIPTFKSAEDLNHLLTSFLGNPDLIEQNSNQLRRMVLESHTYGHRAQWLKESLHGFLKETLRFSIKVGIPGHEIKESWGDWHFAQGIQKALIKQGHVARIDILPEWYTPLSSGDDVVIVLQGLSTFKPDPSKINLLWLISHPDLVKTEELAVYDHIFVASNSFTEKLQSSMGKNQVSTLLQCTDPDLFHPPSKEEDSDSQILFIGNSRGTNRPVVDLAISLGINPHVYGSKWSGIIPEEYVKGQYIPNNELYKFYGNAKVLLNDHWPDMKNHGFISNRLFDAGACGATILSDDILELDQVFVGQIYHYSDAEEFEKLINKLSSSDRHFPNHDLITLVTNNHTFDHRIQQILSTLDKIQNLLITPNYEYIYQIT